VFEGLLKIPCMFVHTLLSKNYLYLIPSFINRTFWVLVISISKTSNVSLHQIGAHFMDTLFNIKYVRMQYIIVSIHDFTYSSTLTSMFGNFP
jgi:hypothetical protein